MGIKAALIVLAIIPTVTHAASDKSVYTLYRTSPVEGMNRIHVATFDTSEGEAYNQENCMIAASLFKKQPGVKVRYWCERGRFTK